MFFRSEMTKTATLWKTGRGSDTVAPSNAGFSLLLEDDNTLLLEDDSELLLEDSVVVAKKPTVWDEPTKNRTNWVDRDGSTTSVVADGDDLVTEAGDNRVTEDGNQRITEEVTLVRKKPTAWSEG